MNIKILLIIIGSIYLGISTGCTQEVKCKKNILIVHYNVENLFDTIDDPHKNDNEFLPQGRKQWTSKRYNDKLQKTAKVISHIDKNKLPDFVSLVEIENRTVLIDLVKEDEIEKANYQIIHHESPDARGIDCALLYNPKSFKLIKSTFYKVKMEGNNYFKTREILYAYGTTKSKDNIHIFVNHWPSRRGGLEKSRPKRALAANVLRHAVDSIISTDANAKIIIVGDFNDETDNESITKVLGLKDSNSPLFNMAQADDNKGIGSYHYWKTNEWNMIDQMIISKALLNAETGLVTKEKSMQIYRADYLLHKNKDGTKVPAKTYGKNYYGGYSDHLAVYQYFYYKCKGERIKD